MYSQTCGKSQGKHDWELLLEIKGANFYKLALLLGWEGITHPMVADVVYQSSFDLCTTKQMKQSGGGNRCKCSSGMFEGKNEVQSQNQLPQLKTSISSSLGFQIVNILLAIEKLIELALSQLNMYWRDTAPKVGKFAFLIGY